MNPEPIVGKDGEKEVDKENLPLKERLSLFFREGREWKFTWKGFFFSFLWLAILIFFLDLLSKWLVQLNVRPGEEIDVIKGFFTIHLTYNEGSAFGLGGGILAMRIVYIVISWLASLLIPLFHWHYLRKGDPWINAVFALTWAGAAGNLIDRTFYWESTTGFSGVIDFFCFYIFGPDRPPFAIFNVADASLTVGIVLLVLVFLVRAVKNWRASSGN